MTLPRWLGSALALIVVALAIFALPARYEGPVLVDISRGHAIAVTDAAALVPLLAGTTLLYWGLWRERHRAMAFARERPALAVIGAFIGGTGLGLLLASSFSSWFWWWAVGAVLFGASIVGACLLAARPPRSPVAKPLDGDLG